MMALPDPAGRFVSRGGEKLSAALSHFRIEPAGWICADLGSHVGGFVDCLLRCGARRVYSVDTAYGTLAWKLRKDPRVVVMERTNAMHVVLPEKVALVTIDVGWTTQGRILPHAATLIDEGGCVVSLIKPHYEARDDERERGVLRAELFRTVVERTLASISDMGWRIRDTLESPIAGHGGNREVFALLERR